MAAGVTVDHEAFGDDRIETLRRLGGYTDFEHALGKMARLWSICTSLQTDRPPVGRIRGVLGSESGDRWLLESGLGELMPDGSIRVRGCQGRIEWFGKLASQQSRAGKKRAAVAERDERGHFRPSVAAAESVQRTPSAPPAEGTEPATEPSDSRAPLDPAHPARSHTAGSSAPSAPQRSPAQEQEQEQEPEPAQDPDQRGPDPVARLDTLPSGASDAGARDPTSIVTSRYPRIVTDGSCTVERARLMRMLGPLHVEVFNRVRAELESQVPAMQHGGPQERALRELLIQQATLEGFEERARHVLSVREAEARKIGSVKFLGASVWSELPFGRAVTMLVGEDRKGPQQTAVEASQRIRDRLARGGDQEDSW